MKFVAAVSIFLGLSMPAAAATFGLDEQIHELEEFWPGRVVIGYKTTTFNFVAGVYCSDDGYVAIPIGDRDKYRPLDAATISDLQARGKLPTPMPSYSLGLGFYLGGYSLWLLLLVLMFGSVLYAKGLDLLNYLIEAKDRLVYQSLKQEREREKKSD